MQWTVVFDLLKWLIDTPTKRWVALVIVAFVGGWFGGVHQTEKSFRNIYILLANQSKSIPIIQPEGGEK